MKLLVAASLSIAVLAGAAAAQSKPAEKPAPKPSATKPTIGVGASKSGKPAPKPATGAAVSAALASLQLTAKELPKDVTLGTGVKCISVQAQIYFDDPGYLQPMIPAPVAKVGQSFLAGKQTLGSVVAFEFAEPVSDDMRSFLGGLLWGEKNPTRQHPELLLVSGRYLAIISLPLGDATTAWFETQLKERLGKLGPRDWSAQQPLIMQALAFQTKHDSAAGLKLLKEHADEIRDYAFGQYMQGELAADAKQWDLAQASYGRAIELNDSGADLLPNPPTILWASVDGLAQALLFDDKVEQAVTAFERAVALSRQMGDDAATAPTLYNYACSLSRAGRFQDSLKALTECIQLAPEHKAMATKDSDFTKARERPDFQKLLGG